jgi:FKBP-type peptidyl-prolyl cis-trans isomerase
LKTSSGLIYDEVEAGTGGQAIAGKTVRVHYTGKFPEGKVFDSSVQRGEPIEFVLGMGRVIKGWDEGIALMKEGGKAKLTIPPQLAYGERGAGGGLIPANATLVFDVELVKVL